MEVRASMRRSLMSLPALTMLSVLTPPAASVKYHALPMASIQ
jgi:hypothetical protein